MSDFASQFVSDVRLRLKETKGKAEIAKEVGIARNSLYRFMRGGGIDAEYFVDLASRLQVAAIDLPAQIPPPPPAAGQATPVKLRIIPGPVAAAIMVADGPAPLPDELPVTEAEARLILERRRDDGFSPIHVARAELANLLPRFAPDSATAARLETVIAALDNLIATIKTTKDRPKPLRKAPGSKSMDQLLKDKR